MEKNYKLIDLNDYVQTGEGGTSLTYTHKTRKALAKLFNPGREAEQAEREFLTARAVFEMGVPTPEPYQLITDGQRQGVEYELIKDKRSFTRIVSQEPERLEEISLSFARMARELHATKADTLRFTSIKETLRRFYLEKGERVTEEYKQRALNFLDKAPDAETSLHGDLHIGNVITDGQRNLWIDLGQFSYGVPEWDLGWMWTICHRMDGHRSDFILHLTPETLTAHWDIFLPAYLGTNDKVAIGQFTKRLMAFYAVKLPFMYDLQAQERLPEAALQQLPQVIE
ncbi:MAG: TIGR02172 family protein [Bacteroidaceae bacterium]|nr:TIGR02172 family protein [Bacteroidaceae bacterium]